ncbi:MAG: hypothetical protein DDT28_01192 [Dehalococcoidia bacterium]|nr:hypothetical protein [Chloroflexota bacterium]
MNFSLSLRAKRSNPFVRDCGACSERKRGISLRVCFGYASQLLALLAMTLGNLTPIFTGSQSATLVPHRATD